MRSVGIICECNPYHSGHQYLARCARESGADCVVGVMSGYFTERGEAAICDPYFRAEALIKGGFDLVLELPYPFSASSAEFFASAGVHILSSLSVDELWFGSECGDLSLLERAAEIAMRDDFSEQYGASTSTSDGTAHAFANCLSAFLGGDVSLSSNDLLGVAYLCAIKRQGSAMQAHTVRRIGSAYLDVTVREGEHPSATAIRSILFGEGLDAAAKWILPESLYALRAAIKEDLAPASLCFAERAVLAHLRQMQSGDADGIAELEGGLGNRLIHAAREARSIEELMRLAATKKYTDSRIRRGILFSMTGVFAEDLREMPHYVRVLAAGERGCELLARNRRQKGIVAVTKQAELPTDAASQRQAELQRRAIGLYAICLDQIADEGTFLRKKPLILK